MLTILTSGVVIAILYFARDVMVPITLAVLLSFMLAPAVRWLRRLRVGRVAAVSVTVLVAFLAICGFAAIIVHEVSSLAQELPQYRYNIEEKIRTVPGIIPGGGVFRRAAAMLHELRRELAKSEVQNAAPASPPSPPGASVGVPTTPIPVEIRQPEPGPLQIVETILGPLLGPLAIAGLVIVFVILILLEREDLRDRLLRLAGRGDLHRTTAAMDDAAQRISRYLLRQLVVNISCGVPIGLGLSLIGIPHAALWGILAALLRFIPYLGIVIAASFPAALAVAVDPGWALLAWTILLFGAIELVVANLLEPWVYGASTGLSAVAVIAAATFWTWLWGPIGLLLSTPMTVCLVVLGRHVPQLQFLDVMLGNEPVLTPDETLFQRLLANDPEEATEQAEEFAREQSLTEFFDDVAIPALARAQADSDRDALSPERRTRIKDGIRAMLENLSDDTATAADASPEHAEKSKNKETPGIVCLAGRNELDEAAGLLLVHLLRAQGRVEIGPVISADALASDAFHPSCLEDAVLVVLSLISTGSPARAHYLVRRVRRRATQAKILLGFWGSPVEELAMIDATGADIVVFSLSDAIAKIALSKDKAKAEPQVVLQ